MKRILCWIFGHEYSEEYDLSKTEYKQQIVDGEKIGLIPKVTDKYKIKFCERCGDYKLHDYEKYFLSH
jgi:hypothetical protein